MSRTIYGTFGIETNPNVKPSLKTKSPFAWPARISEEILKYPERVDPDLFAQAKSYQAHIQSLIAEGSTPEGASKILQQRGYRFRGWNKSLINKLLYPAADFKKPRMPSVPSILGPEFVSSWNKEVLLSKLTESIKRGPFEPVPLPEFYKNIAGRAGRFGLGPELLQRLGSAAPQSLQDIISPPTLTQRAGRLGKSIWGQIRSAPTGYKVAAGFAVGLLGLYALQPGSYFNGFQEQGEAKKNRKWLTDFGSGYQGLDLNDDKTISPLEKRFGGFARALHKYGVETGTGHKRIYIPKDIFSEEDIKELGFTAVKIAIPESGQTRFESFRHSNALYHLHEHGQSWTLHEDVDPSMTMSIKQWSIQKAKGIQTGIGDLPSRVWAGMKHIVTEGIPGAYYYLKGKILGGEDMLRRIQEEISPRYKSLVKRWETQKRKINISTKNIFSGFGRAYNSIEGLFHGGQAERKRKELTDFGSGWRGLVKLPELLQPLIRQRGMSMTRERLATFLGEKISTSAQKKALSEFLFQAGRSPFEEVAVINPLAIRKAAKKQGIAYSKALKGTIAHERLHQRIRQFGLREEIDISVPEGFRALYKNRGMSSEAIAEEYLANAIEMGYISPIHQSQAAKSYIKQNIVPAMNIGNTLEGFGEMGMAGINRKKFGFGSGSIGKRILSLARRIFKNPKAEISLENLISPMSKTQIENIFGRESFSFSPEQIRSGLMDNFISSRQSAREAIKATKSLNQSQEAIFERMISPIAPHKQAQIFGGEAKIVSAEEIRQMSTAELHAKVKYNAPAMAERPKGFKDEVQRMLSQNKVEKLQQRQALHTKAQQDLWKNATKSGRGHLSQTSATNIIR